MKLLCGILLFYLLDILLTRIQYAEWLLTCVNVANYTFIPKLNRKGVTLPLYIYIYIYIYWGKYIIVENRQNPSVTASMIFIKCTNVIEPFHVCRQHHMMLYCCSKDLWQSIHYASLSFASDFSHWVVSPHQTHTGQWKFNEWHGKM